MEMETTTFTEFPNRDMGTAKQIIGSKRNPKKQDCGCHIQGFEK